MSKVVFPDEDASGCSWWCGPMHQVERAVASEVFARFFSIDHFMFMGKLVRRGRPDLYLNKHSFTRRYLNLDDEGHAYRYLPPKYPDSRSHGQYRAHRDLVAAIDNLELHLMPWMMGADLEHEQRGLSYDERWEHPDVIAWYERRSARSVAAYRSERAKGRVV